MRACFLGQNVTALGFGVAMLQSPPLPEPEHPEKPAEKVPAPPPSEDVKTPQAA